MAKKFYEESKIRAIAEKIREKIGGTKTYTTAEMPSGVEEVYDKGYDDGVTITNDATATADKILKGYSAYVNGEKLEGTIAINQGNADFHTTPEYGTVAGGAVEVITMKHTLDEPCVFGMGDNTHIAMYAETSDFGTATAADVLKGRTFTSVDGLKVEGSISTVSGGIEVTTVPQLVDGKVRLSYIPEAPKYLNPNLGNQVHAQANLSAFGDATAADVLEGKTFTSSSGLIATGAMPIVGVVQKNNCYIYDQPDRGYIFLAYTPEEGGYLLPNEPETCRIQLSTPYTNFGNATADDVAAGKTFTSKDGFMVVGTASAGSSPSLIRFYIDGTSYIAYEGMTWIQWCDSKANTDGFVGSSYGVYNSDDTAYVVDAGETTIGGNEIIEEDRRYYLYYDSE